MKLSAIHPNAKNPRIIKDDRFKKMVASIKEFPAMMELRPIVVDTDGTILGGNMRYKAIKELGMKEIPDTWVKSADKLTDDEKKRFIVEDNIQFGDWDEAVLSEDYSLEDLQDWGVELGSYGVDVDDSDMTDNFSLPDGDKAPFQQMAFTLADAQAEEIKAAMERIKKTDDYKYGETHGNENTNGNALYTIVRLWAEQKKS